jgi:hypothetical protein
VKQPTLRPSDVAVALRLARTPAARYQDLASGLLLGIGEVHRGVVRLERAGLVDPGERRVNRQALLEFLVHGVGYSFAAVLGPAAPGVPTAAAAPPLAGELTEPVGPPLVWPSPGGPVQGTALLPLYPAAPRAALADAQLYRALALVDVLRTGALQERRRARVLLDGDFSGGAAGR